MTEQEPVLAFGRVPALGRYDLFMERYRSAAEIVRSHLALSPESRILDVGCGEGLMKLFFDEDEGSWVGIETWKERAEHCLDLGYEVIDLNLDEVSLPFPDDSFDVVFGSHVIEHLKDSGEAIREMGRVTKPAGLLLVATPTKPPLTAGLARQYHRLRREETGDTCNAFTGRSLRRHLLSNLSKRGADWRIVDCRGFRVLSARRKLKRLLDRPWFYRANLNLARVLPWIVPEVNVVLQKPTPGNAESAAAARRAKEPSSSDA